MTPHRRVHLLPRHQWQTEGRVLRGHLAERLNGAHGSMLDGTMPTVRTDPTPSALNLVVIALVAALFIVAALVMP